MRWPVRLAGTAIISLTFAAVADGQLYPPEPASSPTAPERNLLTEELKETKDRLRAFEAENESLRRRNESNKTALRTLDESLAVANAESEFFRRQYGDLKLRMEALGMESVGDNKEALEQRLLKAVRDLNLAQEARDRLSERLVALSETVMLFIKSAKSTDPQQRLEIESQLRAANDAVSSAGKGPADAATPPAGELTDATVISVKEDYALVVGNIGVRQGVKTGMPFRVLRGGQSVARVRVISVRDRIFGAVIEGYDSTADAVKVGDNLRVDTQQ